MTREVIDLIINDVKAGYPNASSDEIMETLKTKLGASYDDFMENAVTNRVKDIIKEFDELSYLPSHPKVAEWLENFILDKLDILTPVKNDYVNITLELSDYALKVLMKEFCIAESKKEVLWDYMNNQDTYNLEWLAVEYMLVKNSMIHDLTLDGLSECVREHFNVCFADEPTDEVTNTELVKEKYVESYPLTSHLCATIASSLALTYAIINTNNYCGDMGVNVVSCSTPLALTNLGFSKADCEGVAKLQIGETYMSEDYGNGAVVTRMA